MPPAFRIEPAAAGTGSAKRYQSPRNAPAIPAKRSGSVPHDWLRSIEWREGSCRAFHVHAVFFFFVFDCFFCANTPSERAKASKSFSVKISSPCCSIRKAPLSGQEPKRTRLRSTPSLEHSHEVQGRLGVIKIRHCLEATANLYSNCRIEVRSFSPRQSILGSRLSPPQCSKMRIAGQNPKPPWAGWPAKISSQTLWIKI